MQQIASDRPHLPCYVNHGIMVVMFGCAAVASDYRNASGCVPHPRVPSLAVPLRRTCTPGVTCASKSGSRIFYVGINFEFFYARHCGQSWSINYSLDHSIIHSFAHSVSRSNRDTHKYYLNRKVEIKMGGLWLGNRVVLCC